MDYTRLLESVLLRLEELGVEPTAEAGEPATDEALAAVQAELGIRLPAELREFYREIGDGFSLFWRSDPDDAKKPWGGIHVPDLSSLAGLYTNWRGIVLYSPERAEEYGFPYTKDPTLAKRTAARMWHWLPVIEEANGDAICVDLGNPACPVVFNRHDWMDGGSGDDGHSLAPNWHAFLADWGSVCFQLPKSLYWPLCFRPEGGVAWDSDEFRDPFRVPGLNGPSTPQTAT